MNAASWFYEWLDYHKTINAHARYRDYEAPGRDLIYAGWVKAFDARRIDQSEAEAASQAMQAEDKRELYPEHHLARLIELVAADRSAKWDAAAECRASRQAEAEADQQAQARGRAIQDAWAKLEEPIRERYRELARKLNPQTARWRPFVEANAQHHWAEDVRSRRRAARAS